MVCFKTIYRWINANLFTSLFKTKGKRQPSKETRGHFNVGKSISQRLLNIKSAILWIIGRQVQLFQAEYKVKAAWLLLQKENLAIIFVFLYLIALLNQ